MTIESLYHLQFQYGNPDVLCSPLAEAKKNGTDLVVSSLLFESRIKRETFSKNHVMTKLLKFLFSKDFYCK